MELQVEEIGKPLVCNISNKRIINTNRSFNLECSQRLDFTEAVVGIMGLEMNLGVLI